MYQTYDIISVISNDTTKSNDDIPVAQNNIASEVSECYGMIDEWYDT